MVQVQSALSEQENSEEKSKISRDFNELFSLIRAEILVQIVKSNYRHPLPNTKYSTGYNDDSKNQWSSIP